MPLTPKKTLQTIINGGNHYLAALKGNQPKLYEAFSRQLFEASTWEQVNKGHGRREKRRISVCYLQEEALSDWAGLATVIKVESERQTKQKSEKEIRYYISDLKETAEAFATRIRGYWGVENKVHYVRDVTQGEDNSRTRTTPLPQIWTIARNLALNLYRDFGFSNMAQAQRKCSFGLDQILSLFRMK